jgi:hypothetical protein
MCGCSCRCGRLDRSQKGWPTAARLRLCLRSFPHSHPSLAIILSAATKDVSRFCRGSFFGLRFFTCRLFRQRPVTVRFRLRLRSFPYSHPPLAVILSAAKDLSSMCQLRRRINPREILPRCTPQDDGQKRRVVGPDAHNRRSRFPQREVAFREVFPRRISRFYQRDFLRPHPSLDLLFPRNRATNVPMLFPIHEPLHVVLRRKSLDQLLPMLNRSSRQSARNAGVKHPRLARKNIYVPALHSAHLSSPATRNFAFALAEAFMFACTQHGSSRLRLTMLPRSHPLLAVILRSAARTSLASSARSKVPGASVPASPLQPDRITPPRRRLGSPGGIKRCERAPPSSQI